MYPCGQAQIQEALQDSGAAVRYLSLGGGYDGGPYGVVPVPGPSSLVRCWWSTGTNPLRRADRGGGKLTDGWAGLDLFAVPSARAAAARAHLLGGVLQEVVTWIAAVSTRGNAWQASDHELVLFLEAEGIRRTEV